MKTLLQIENELETRKSILAANKIALLKTQNKVIDGLLLDVNNEELKNRNLELEKEFLNIEKETKKIEEKLKAVRLLFEV